MRLLIFCLLFSLTTHAQLTADASGPFEEGFSRLSSDAWKPVNERHIRMVQPKWKMTGNRWLTGALVFTAGASKGFNETLMFHWKSFRHKFPGANPNWFNPAISWRNKYQDKDPNKGAKFLLSTSALVMFTDQYHLNTFINRAAWTSTLVIKIGEGKKPFKHYVYDFLYYTVCHQAGFAMTYYPFKNYR